MSGQLAERSSLRHGGHLLLLGVMCGLSLAVMVWPDLLPHRGRPAWIVGVLTAAGFAAGWPCRGRRPGLGGWIAGGGVAAAWALGLSLALAVEIEGRAAVPAVIDNPGTGDSRAGSLHEEIDRTLIAAQEHEERQERAWGRLLPLGLAMPPATLAGMLGATLGRNRRRKRHSRE